MKTDWHRYNLKRRVAGLAPVDAAVYAEKVQQSMQFQEETDEFGFKVIKPHEQKPKKLHIHRTQYHPSLDHTQRGRVEATRAEDSIDRDSSPASVTSHLSRFSLGDSVYSHPETHTDIESNFETASEADTADLDYVDTHSDSEESDIEAHSDYEEEPLQPITSCIFCGIPHKDIETNVTHMFKSHGLYIPERSYLVDLRGLLSFLISTIVIDNECLCCNFQGKNLQSIRAHVTSKGHCRLPYETKLERALFARYYDFSSLNSKAKKSKSTKSVGFTDADDTIVVDAETSVSDDDDNDDVETGAEDEEGSDNGINDNYTVATVDSLGSELTLPNGSRLGHRSLQRYYRQNIQAPRTPTESQLTVSNADRRLASGLTIAEHDKQLKDSQIKEAKFKNRNMKRETKRVNFQMHFRDQMLGG